MKKICIILLLLSSFAFSQDVPGKRARLDTLKAFSTNYAQLDTQWLVSRTRFTRPGRFDSSVSILQNLTITGTTIGSLRGTFPSLAVDTVVGRSSGNKIYLQDSVLISGNLTAGESQYNIGKGSYVFGYADSNYSTATATGGRAQNYIFGNNNVVGRVNPSTTYGNWLFGQYLRSENLGLWAFGADDDFQKKIIPFEGTIAFVNEHSVHWHSNTMSGLFSITNKSFGLMTPHVKDTALFAYWITKYGSDVDSLANAGYSFNIVRGFPRTMLPNGEVKKIDINGTTVKRLYSVNNADDDSWHFNSFNTSGRPFAPIYIDSNDLVVSLGDVIASAGYLDGDSLRRNGSTVLTGTWHSGLSASALGAITSSSLTSQGAISGTTISGTAISGTSVTGTAALTMGGNSALTHAIRSSSFPPLFVTRTTNTATASAGSIELAGWNSANAEVGYATIGSQVVLNTAGIHSGNMLGRIYRGGVRTIAWWVDTLARFSVVGDGRTSPLSTTSMFAVKGTNQSINLLEWYRYGSTTVQGFIDSLGTVAQKGSFKAVSAKTANYTATTADYLITVDATSGAVTITLPPLSSAYNSTLGVGLILNITKIDASGNGITLDGSGSETIDGVTSITTAVQWTNYQIQATSAGWVIL